MLHITIPASPDEEYWDEAKEEFVYRKGNKEITIALEHSLVSLQKWESKWHVPFLSKEDKTEEQVLDYIKMMTITQNVPDEVYTRLSEENLKEIDEYIKNPMTATWFKDDSRGKGNNTIITAERVYAWMVELQIPESYRKWHFNQLMTLIKVVDEDNKPKKKMPSSEIARQNAKLNEARKAKYKTKR